MRFYVAVLGLILVGGSLQAAERSYVGIKKCKMCHKTSKIGNQYGIWEKSAHAKAFEALKSDTAKAVAKKLGIEDPTTSEKCLKCHTTGFGAGGYDLKKSAEENAKFEGVQCEACHGPGSEYKSLKVMKGLAEGKVKPEEVGLIIPTEETCKTCHTPEGNPFYKEFKFDERVKLIAHPVPKK
jgi:hypothetical protein